MAADSSNAWAMRQLPEGLRKISKQQQQPKASSPSTDKNIVRKAVSDDAVNHVKQEVNSSVSSPKKNMKAAVSLNNDEKLSTEHGTANNAHRSGNLTVSTSDELQQKLARVLGPMERFFGIPEVSIRQAVGITPQPPTPVSMKDSSRHKDDESNNSNNNNNNKGLNSTPPSAKLLSTTATSTNAGDESASSNKTSSVVPLAAAPMKKTKSVVSTTTKAGASSAAATGEKVIQSTGGDDSSTPSSLLQRGVKSATSSPNFLTAAAEPRSGSQRQPATDLQNKKRPTIVNSELNQKLFGCLSLSSSESESESDDSDGNDSTCATSPSGEQHRLLATVPPVVATSNNNNNNNSSNSNKKPPMAVAPIRKTGRHAMTSQKPPPPAAAATNSEETPPATKSHNVPPPLLITQPSSSSKDLHQPASTNVTPLKGGAGSSSNRGNAAASIDDISSIYKNVTLPSPVSQLLSPVGISSDMLLSSRASLSSLSKQQFSPVVPSLSSAAATTAEKPAPVENPSNSNVVKSSPRSPPSTATPPPAVAAAALSPPLPTLHPPPSWSLSSFTAGVSDTSKQAQNNNNKQTTLSTSKNTKSKEGEQSSSRKTKLPSGSEVEASAKQPAKAPVLPSPKHESSSTNPSQESNGSAGVRRQLSFSSGKTTEPVAPPQVEKASTPDHAAASQITSSKVPKVRRVIGESSSPKPTTTTTAEDSTNKSSSKQQKTQPPAPAQQKSTPKLPPAPPIETSSSCNKRPASATFCHVAIDTSDLPRSSGRAVQTSPDFVVKAGRECGFFVDGYSQTSWDLRAAFSTNVGVQAGPSSLADAIVQTEASSSDAANSASSSGSSGQDAFGPTAPKQARRETACVQPLSVISSSSNQQQESAGTSMGGDSSTPSSSSAVVDPQSQLLRSKFTIKPKTTPGGTNGGSSPFDSAVPSSAELERRERERRINVNVIDWRGTYTEQTLQSEKTYYERGRLSKREADQEFPKQRNLDAFCIYLDAMLAFLLQVCAHESAHGGKAESKRRSQLLTFIDEALSKCAPTARDLTIDPRWDIPLVLCHQSKAVLATRLYDMQSRDMLSSAASSIEKAVAVNNGPPTSNNVTSNGGNAASPPGSVGSNSSAASSSSIKKDAGGKPAGFSHLAKSIEMVTNAFRLLEASKTSWARSEELAEKHKPFFDRFSPTLTLRASLLDLSSYLDRCITEFRALRNATGPPALISTSGTPGTGVGATKSALKPPHQQLMRPTPPATTATSKH